MAYEACIYEKSKKICHTKGSQRPTSKWFVREHLNQNNAYNYIDSGNQLPTTMLSNRARILDIVQPTQCYVPPHREVEKLSQALAISRI